MSDFNAAVDYGWECAEYRAKNPQPQTEEERLAEADCAAFDAVFASAPEITLPDGPAMRALPEWITLCHAAAMHRQYLQVQAAQDFMAYQRCALRACVIGKCGEFLYVLARDRAGAAYIVKLSKNSHFAEVLYEKTDYAERLKSLCGFKTYNRLRLVAGEVLKDGA